MEMWLMRRQFRTTSRRSSKENLRWPDSSNERTTGLAIIYSKTPVSAKTAEEEEEEDTNRWHQTAQGEHAQDTMVARSAIINKNLFNREQ